MLKKISTLVIVAALGATFAASGAALAQSSDQTLNAPDPMQIARGAQSWADNCGRCHNIRAPKELTDEDWEVSVMHMRVRANIPGDVARDIAEFLKQSN